MPKPPVLGEFVLGFSRRAPLCHPERVERQRDDEGSTRSDLPENGRRKMNRFALIPYNNEGEEAFRSHLGEPYGPGFYAFDRLLQECATRAIWRASSWGSDLQKQGGSRSFTADLVSGIPLTMPVSTSTQALPRDAIFLRLCDSASRFEVRNWLPADARLMT
jgi:hypothetical protein